MSYVGYSGRFVAVADSFFSDISLNLTMVLVCFCIQYANNQGLNAPKSLHYESEVLRSVKTPVIDCLAGIFAAAKDTFGFVFSTYKER